MLCIDAETVIIPYFILHDESILKLSSLGPLRKAIESNLGVFTYVDLTRDSIFDAICCKPGVINWNYSDDNFISFNASFKPHLSLDSYIYRIPEEVSEKYIKILKEFKQV